MNKQNRIYENILAITAGLLLMYFIFDLKGLLLASFVIATVSLFIPIVAYWISWSWMKLSEVLGYISSRILLTGIFFFLLFPLSVLYRLFAKRDKLLLKKEYNSYFIKRDHAYGSSEMEKLW